MNMRQLVATCGETGICPEVLVPFLKILELRLARDPKPCEVIGLICNWGTPEAGGLSAEAQEGINDVG